MKLKKARRYVKRFTYKPGSKIRLRMCPTIVVVSPPVKDSRGRYKGKKPIETRRAVFVDSMSRQDIADAIGGVIQSQDSHEHDEWLMFDGKMLEDPHG